MSDFDPGEGWREVPVSDYTLAYQHKQRRVAYTGEDGVGHFWIRQEPMPPLPTEQETLIRVTWVTGAKYRYVLDKAGLWRPVGMTMPYTPAELLARITDFKVLARPAGDYAYDRVTAMEQVKRETAKAVIEHIEAGMGKHWKTIDAARDKFGVEE